MNFSTMHISAGDVLCESETISSCHFIFQFIYYLGSVRLAIHHMQWFMLWMHSLCNLLGVCLAAAFRQSICADASAFQQAECSLLACLLSKCRWRIVPQVIFLYWFFAQCGLQSRMQWIPVCFAFSQYCALTAFALWSGRRRPFVMLCERNHRLYWRVQKRVMRNSISMTLPTICWGKECISWIVTVLLPVWFITHEIGPSPKDYRFADVTKRFIVLGEFSFFDIVCKMWK